MTTEEAIRIHMRTRLSRMLFRISGGVDDFEDNLESSGPWKDGHRYQYGAMGSQTGSYAKWEGCWADIFIAASEVLQESS